MLDRPRNVSPEDSDARLSQLMRAESARRLLAMRLAVSSGRLVAALIEHAVRTVPRYAESPDQLDAFSPLAQFPTVTRGEIAARSDHFASRSFPADECIVMTTSGTTGTPLSVRRDPASYYSFAYDTYREVFDRIPELPRHLEPGACAVILVNDNPQRSEQISLNPSLNLAYVHRVILGRSSDTDLRSVSLCVTERPPLLYGRPRSLIRLAELAEHAGPEYSHAIRPLAILCSGDNLYPDERRYITTAFEAPVYNAYASQEAGFVALECNQHDGLHVLATRGVAEVWNAADGQPVNEGHGELVITGLENWALPLIRYRTGDSVAIDRQPCACGSAAPRLTALDGRDSTYFSVAGTQYNPSLLNLIFEELPVAQFQVVQQSISRFDVRWVPRCPDTELAAVQSKLAVALTHALGPAVVDVRPTDSIGRPDQKVQRYVRKNGIARSA